MAQKIIHSTLEPTDLNKDIEADYALIGDASLTLDALISEVEDRLKGKTTRFRSGREENSGNENYLA